MIRVLRLKWGLLVLGLLSLVSCLEDIENQYNPGTMPAVTCVYGDSAFLMLKTPLGMVYDESLSSRQEGECLLASFTYNPADPMNKDASSRGYYYVEMAGTTSLERLGTSSGLTDTTRLLANEVAVMPTAAIDFDDYFVCLNHFLFMPVVYMTLPGARMSWELSYDPAQSPVVENRLPVYSLYLRGTMVDESQGATEEGTEDGGSEGEEVEPESASDVIVFDLGAFLSDIEAHGAQSSGINVRIHFMEGADSGTAGLRWGMTNSLLVN